MGALFGLECRKIFARKGVWLFVALIVLFQLLAHGSAIRDTLNGTVRGMQDVYRRYEGQAIDRAFQLQAEADYAQIALSHPDQFSTSYDEGQNHILYGARGIGYYAGVDAAYSDIIYGPSVEMLQRSSQAAEGAVEPTIVPVVHNLGGWYTLGRTMGTGMLLLLLMLWGLLPLFTQEHSARMDAVLLSTAKRGRAAAAKVLTAVAFTLAGAVLVCGSEALLVGITLGLDGASAPMAALYHWSFPSDLSIGAYYALAAGIVAAAALAWSALVSLASSWFRNPIAALLAVVACLAVQMVPALAIHSSSLLYDYTHLLPAPVLATPWDWLDRIAKPDQAIFALVFPCVVASAALGLSPKCFLRNRRA